MSPPIITTTTNIKEIAVTCQIPGMKTKEKFEESDGMLYQELELSNEGLTTDIGKPQLPQIGRWFAIPQGAEVEVEIVKSDYQILEGYNIYPAQKPMPEDGTTEAPPFEKDMDLYSKDEFYPSQIVSLDSPQELRGLNASVLRVVPFQFNPVKQELKAYSQVTAKVSFIGGKDYFLDEEFRAPGNESFYISLINRGRGSYARYL